MRVLADERLQGYSFVVNEWRSKDPSSWPLARSLADQWLSGWNRLDRFAPTNILTVPSEDPPAVSSAGRLGQLHP